MENVIEVNNLITYYGKRKILDNISFNVKKAETLVILGGSGCGKSTLLKHLIGLLKPYQGSIKILGKEIVGLKESELDAIRLKFGMLFQSGGLFNSMSVFDNVALPLREHTNLSEKVIKITTRIKLELVGLSGFENLMPSELSGGMKKRAGLARAMVMDPKILFFDEPSAGLDPIAAKALDFLILKLKKAFKMAIVIVTHEMGSAFRIADKMIMLNKGKIIFNGTPDEIVKSTDERVKAFLKGEVNENVMDTDMYLEMLTN